MKTFFGDETVLHARNIALPEACLFSLTFDNGNGGISQKIGHCCQVLLQAYRFINVANMHISVCMWLVCSSL
jgi:hypothetical protein